MNTDSITENMQQIAEPLQNLSDESKRKMKRVMGQVMDAIFAVERQYGPEDLVAKCAVAFAIFSAADGLSKQTGPGGSTGLIELLS